DGRTAPFSHWMLHNTFYGLVITTTLSTTLLAADRYKWRATGMVYSLANRYPASVAFTVQLLAAFFGVIHVAVICKLINYALRLRLKKASVSLDVLRTWVDMTIPRIDWDLPLRFFFPVMCMVLLSLVPAALWAGSFAPLVSSTRTWMQLEVPAYGNVSFIKEYPMEIGKAGPSVRNSKGLFTYSVGQQLIAPLLSAAAGSSSNDSAKLVHAKIDNTQFSYTGRSYGVGASVGLRDIAITQPATNAAGYKYAEEGYLTTVTCIYNQTSNFTLSGPVNEWIYSAAGNLPDSVEGPEYSNYIGHNAKAIVAMGVAYSELSPRRYVAITAGDSYAHLNNTQCEFDFTPTMFDVTVDLANLNIRVKPSYEVPDFNPSRNLTRTVVRQFELLSNDLTNLYDSLLGQALNSSIAAYAMTTGGTWPPLTQEQRTLGGLTNAMTAMADDMLVAYGAAQLMVRNKYRYSPRGATVSLYALQFGQPAYIYAIFALNTAIVLAVLVERYRTHVWKDLTRFNYLDPRDLIVAASRGGAQLAIAADNMVGQDGTKIPKHVWLLSDPDEGNGRLVVRLRADEDGHAAIEVDGERSE
ncbi:uncharacterized protein CC84DRAFT_1073278, partial [Paraphaeosphaeria sporulosa]